MDSSRPPAHSDTGGIDPDLVPYLEAADAPEAQVRDVDDSSNEVDEALAALVGASLVGGPLGEECVREHARPTDEEADDEAFEVAAARAVAAERAHMIYQAILERAPEHRVQPSLHRITRVLEWMGDPQLAYTTVHVAGTNGKTSTARMIECLVRASGQRTGLFTSPHLSNVRERVCIDGAPISAEGFVRAWEDVEAFIELVDAESRASDGVRLSFFECFVALAFQAFADAPVGLAVVEVGLGGTWDATNVLDSAVQVITPIARDHEKWLGESIEQIAENKAGIIRPGGLVVSGRQCREALEVLERTCAERGATLRLLGRDFDVVASEKAVGGSLISVRTPAAMYDDIYVPLFGAHQADNAACAIAAVELLASGQALDAALVERGMTAVTSPGRAEVVGSSPTVLVDSAHNPHGAASLRRLLDEDFGQFTLVGVFAGMADKNTEGVLTELEPVLDDIVVTTLPSERALDVDAVRAIAADVFGPERVVAVDTVAEALDAAAGIADATGLPAQSVGVVCFGSVVLAGSVRELFGKHVTEE